MDNRFFMTIIKATLVIFLVHFVLKRYIVTQAVPLHPLPQPGGEKKPPPKYDNQSDISSEISEEDIRSKLQDFANSYEEEDEDNEMLPNVIAQSKPKSVEGDIEGLKYYSSYRPVELIDRPVDVAGQVRIPPAETPSATGRPPVREFDPTLQYIDKSGEGVMTGGQIMEGVTGFDNYYDDFFEV